MGLERKICINCKTTYYGNDKKGMDDGSCFMCSVIGKFLYMFKIGDLSINEIDFNRIRNPQWIKRNTEDSKDWRNYIPLGLIEMWNNLPIESRAIAIMFAEREARAVDIVSTTFGRRIHAEGKKC